MKLKVWAFGVSVGLVWGAMMFLATAIDVIKGGGEHLGLLKVFYLGYQVSWPGAIIGLGWGFVTGLLAGVIIALVYNSLSGEKQK